MQIIKEVCVDSFNDAINAEKNGANRIELCGRLDLDGLTPSKKLISKVFSNLKIPIRVMIRPKHPSFVYSDDEIQQMLEDITYCKELGVDGVVLGCLNENSYLDIEKIDLLSKIAKPLNVIIHKAIDSTESVIDSILLLLKNENINGVLTSGGQQFAKDSIETLKKMLDLAPDSFEIICAGGVTYENFNKLHSLVKGKYYHGKKIIKFK
ncbi:MAG: copper homeostasis protein CutC [Flavobacteriaceae bacterium]|jgi:copper homeostasis protein|nr:copper homeostasis protein CutC [Flavobacteriaceae bacterium]MBT3753957.1 copper homeostasis protein CutC [Flavobacteriaceae bacterium]MBT3793782.1 copper homeostasis protein CutC [Flavobacteriaceae bacterium]MBT4246248.1 copper homeostasis protein CutC [Flavobacteriaceae bacterium]MBT4416454.1 copper homeostasis protein CutC [Flavobacteriaceae bacterium]